MPRAHAHNDFEHERPLLDALAHGFTSVEADVWLVNGELLVAHGFWSLRPTRTLESLYLQPLRDRIAAHHGRVYTDWPHSTQLLLDIKTDADRTYVAVHQLLKRYRQHLTKFIDGRVYESALTVVISGNRPRELMQQQRVRYAGYDGRSADVAAGTPAIFAPLISERWHALFDWDGNGKMPAAERRQLHAYVQRAHSHGQQVRFWSTPEASPEREAVWTELTAAGVDFINTDHLTELNRWLTARAPHPSQRWLGELGRTPSAPSQPSPEQSLLQTASHASQRRERPSPPDGLLPGYSASSQSGDCCTSP